MADLFEYGRRKPRLIAWRISFGTPALGIYGIVLSLRISCGMSVVDICSGMSALGISCHLLALCICSSIRLPPHLRLQMRSGLKRCKA